MQPQYYTNSPRLTSGDPEEKRAELLDYFLKTYTQYEALFDLLKSDTIYYEQPNLQRHPLIFYFGHTAVFYINKLIASGLISERLDGHYESMFAVGVDEMEWDDLDASHYTWPSVEEVRAYRDRTKAFILRYIEQMPLTVPIGWEDPAWIILMGIEHERIHLETSSVLFRQLPIDALTPNPELWPLCPNRDGTTPDNRLLEVSGGVVLKEASIEHPEYYGWDNEFGMHTVNLQSFKASKYLVSNGEFLAFVNDGGYDNLEWWCDEGKTWCKNASVTHPEFWVKKDDGYHYRALTHIIPMPLDWPVDVNYLEAKAYTKWLSHKLGKSLRLPTEDEWYRLREHCNLPTTPPYTKQHGNLNLTQYASSTPVTANAHGEFFDVIGNVWQWSETAMYPFEGFQTHPAYDDFTVPTFDTLHNLMKGGSWISTGNEISLHSRYQFRRHFHQHAGFRYVESHNPLTTETDLYETDTLISQYCEFHYGETYFDTPNFPKRAAEFALQAMNGHTLGRALDIGCGVGRSSFELAKHFEHVTGIDFSTRFIRHALELRDMGRLSYYRTEEGMIKTPITKTLDHCGLEDSKEHLEFWQGDACNLKPHFTGYDLILAVNLIDRLYDPTRFLQDLHHRLNPNGLLILGSPYSWDEAHTPKEKWIGGVYKRGRALSSLEALDQLLNTHFKRLQEPQSIPFVIRESKRKFQHTLSEFTIWEKR